MAWFTRFDRFGSAHMVRSQDKGFSCAMASIIMVNFKLKKGLLAAGMAAGTAVSVVPVVGSFLGHTLTEMALENAIKSEPEVYKLYEQFSGSAHDFDVSGATRTFYPKILEALGLGRWETVNVGEAAFAQAVIDATANGCPVMGSITWDGGGGHAVCIDETHGWIGSSYLCVCDPWDGELRLIKATAGNAVKYDGSDKPVSISFGGNRHDYPAGNNKGTFNGWITRRL